MFSYPMFFMRLPGFSFHLGFHFCLVICLCLLMSFASRLRLWIWHRCCIDLGMDLDHNLETCFMNYPFADPPCKTFKQMMTIPMNSYVLWFGRVPEDM